MKYQVVKGITGLSIKYNCPNCKSGLKSALREAGDTDACPDCGTTLIVPGTKERETVETHQREQKEAADRAKREKLVLKERAKNEREQQEIGLRRQQAEQKRQIEARAAEREFMRSESLANSSFDPANHDWSQGGPYVYHCVELGTLSGNWQTQLVAIINENASRGWDYYRSESLVAERPAGCLMTLLLRPTIRFQVVVVVFRKPATVVSREREVNAQLG